MKSPELKIALYEFIHKELDQKIESARQDVQSNRESRDTATKSTAGDKHETSRALMQTALDNSEAQLNKTVALKNQLNKIDPQKELSEVEFGCLVTSERGTFFISIPFGKVEIDGTTIFVISPAAPLAQAMLGKKAGEAASFQGGELKIKEVL
jgi:transcription elongation GreA/GreB family factor